MASQRAHEGRERHCRFAAGRRVRRRNARPCPDPATRAGNRRRSAGSGVRGQRVPGRAGRPLLHLNRGRGCHGQGAPVVQQLADEAWCHGGSAGAMCRSIAVRQVRSTRAVAFRRNSCGSLPPRFASFRRRSPRGDGGRMSIGRASRSLAARRSRCVEGVVHARDAVAGGMFRRANRHWRRRAIRPAGCSGSCCGFAGRCTCWF